MAHRRSPRWRPLRQALCRAASPARWTCALNAMRRAAWRSHCLRSSTTRSTISRSSQWKYLPSIAAITSDAVSSGANVVSTAVGPQRRDGHGAPDRHQFRGSWGGLNGVGRSAKKKCCEHRSFCRALLRHPRSSQYDHQKVNQLLFLLQNEFPRPPCTHPLALTQGQGSRARWEWGGVVEEDLAGAVLRGGEERSASGRFVGGEEG